MNIKDQLSQELRNQGYTYQTLARKDIYLSEPKVREALEGDKSNAFVISKISKILGIETYEELRPATPKLLSLICTPNTEGRKETPKTQALTKGKPRRAKHTLDMAKGESCVECGNQEGKTISAHYDGILAHEVGKARGQKGDDYWSAFLCDKCHAEADQKKYTNGIATELEKVWASHRFLVWIIKTLIRKVLRLEAENQRLRKGVK